MHPAADAFKANGSRPGLFDDPKFQERIVNRMSEILQNDQSPWPMARQWFARMMSPNDGVIDEECRYPPTSALSPSYFRDLYDRDPLANRAVQLLPKECWGSPPTVFEDESSTDVTEFEQAWDELPRNLTSVGQSWYKDETGSPVWQMCQRADSLSRIGHFGLILLGIDDGMNLEQPLEGAVTLENSYVPVTNSRGQVLGMKVVKGRLPNPLSFPLHKDSPLGDTERAALVANLKDVNGEELRALDRIQARQRADAQRRPTNNALRPHHAIKAELIPLCRKLVKSPLAMPGYGALDIKNDGSGELWWTGGDSDGEGFAELVRETLSAVRGVTKVTYRVEVPPPRVSDVLGGGATLWDEVWINDGRDYSASPVYKAQLAADDNDPTGNRTMPFLQETDGDAAENVVTDLTGKDLYGGLLAAQPGSTLSGTDQQYFGVQFGPPEQVSDKPSKKKRKLLFMRAYDESLVQVVRYEWNIRNPRFGMPTMYRVTLNDPRETHSGIGLPLATVFVHWSRVIHLNDVDANAGPSEIFSAPILRAILNPILDDRKVCGAGAEGYWKACITALSWETHPQLGGDADVDENDMKNQIKNFFAGLTRALMSKGGSWKTLAPTVVDPTPHHTLAVERICIQLGCPVRVFKGSERGELASAQDDSKWNDTVRARQNGYCTPRIICPLIDRLIMVGVLPEPEQYVAIWPDLDSLGEKDKAGILLQKTQALAAFVQGGCEAAMSLDDWYTRWAGMDEEQANEVTGAAKKVHDDQETMTIPPQIQGQDSIPPAGTAADQQQKQQAQQAKTQATAMAKGQAASAAPVVVPKGGKAIHPASVKPPAAQSDGDGAGPVDNANPNHDEHGRFAESEFHGMLDGAIKHAKEESGTHDTSLESFCEPFAESLARKLKQSGHEAIVMTYSSDKDPIQHTFVRAKKTGVGLRYVDASGIYKSKDELLTAYEKKNPEMSAGAKWEVTANELEDELKLLINTPDDHWQMSDCGDIEDGTWNASWQEELHPRGPNGKFLTPDSYTEHSPMVLGTERYVGGEEIEHGDLMHATGPQQRKIAAANPPREDGGQVGGSAGAVPAGHTIDTLVSRLRQVDAASGGHNFVHLGDLRDAHPDLSKPQFDALLHRARADGKVTLSGAEGRHGISQRDKDSAVHEQGHGSGQTMLLYASVRRPTGNRLVRVLKSLLGWS